ncbi:ribonuclease BN (tRNA processing enzyme) [Crossiella equi]|uniref:Ribonuclease BN (tRNA processing enzyme) n=1 Tax=Crossiella equi TaxID=130796 RepID=A0ABS5AJK3_9PSEU|nr:MBL fold metallo-hydrolase [Crossiella equi]MBP2476745.1 ribonuclease BN (tRNA processing enzyme) [Crossiella equi]
MLLTVLGCSGSIPAADSPASGYLVEADGFRVLLDLGNGVLGALQKHGDPFGIDALVLSHLHPDHCADFASLTVLRRYHPRPPYDTRARRLPVYAPGEAPTRLAAAYAPSEQERLETDLSDVYEFHPLTPGTIHLGPFELTSELVAHPCEAYGFRLTAGGRTLAFTGDSGPCEALRKLADTADLLLAEACWTHDPAAHPPDLHLSGLEAGQLAAACGVRRLVVTHVPPWADREEMAREAGTAFGGDVELARPGAVYQV